MENQEEKEEGKKLRNYADYAQIMRSVLMNPFFYSNGEILELCWGKFGASFLGV